MISIEVNTYNSYKDLKKNLQQHIQTFTHSNNNYGIILFL